MLYVQTELECYYLKSHIETIDTHETELAQIHYI